MTIPAFAGTSAVGDQFHALHDGCRINGCLKSAFAGIRHPFISSKFAQRQESTGHGPCRVEAHAGYFGTRIEERGMLFEVIADLSILRKQKSGARSQWRKPLDIGRLDSRRAGPYRLLVP